MVRARSEYDDDAMVELTAAGQRSTGSVMKTAWTEIADHEWDTVTRRLLLRIFSMR